MSNEHKFNALLLPRGNKKPKVNRLKEKNWKPNENSRLNSCPRIGGPQQTDFWACVRRKREYARLLAETWIHVWEARYSPPFWIGNNRVRECRCLLKREWADIPQREGVGVEKLGAVIGCRPISHYASGCGCWRRAAGSNLIKVNLKCAREQSQIAIVWRRPPLQPPGWFRNEGRIRSIHTPLPLYFFDIQAVARRPVQCPPPANRSPISS